jgi:hypothetical protein
MALRVRLGNHREKLARPALRQLERIAHDALDANRVKIATSVPTSSGRPRWTRPPQPAYSPSGALFVKCKINEADLYPPAHNGLVAGPGRGDITAIALRRASRSAVLRTPESQER